MKIINAASDYVIPLKVKEMNTCLSNAKLDMHIGTVDEKSNPNLPPTWDNHDTEPDEIQFEYVKNSQKVKNLKNNRITYNCIYDPALSYQGVKYKSARRSCDIISEDVHITEKNLIKFLSLNNWVSEKIIPNVQTENGIILRISQSYLLLSMGL